MHVDGGQEKYRFFGKVYLYDYDMLRETSQSVLLGVMRGVSMTIDEL